MAAGHPDAFIPKIQPEQPPPIVAATIITSNNVKKRRRSLVVEQVLCEDVEEVILEHSDVLTASYIRILWAAVRLLRMARPQHLSLLT